MEKSRVSFSLSLRFFSLTQSSVLVETRQPASIRTDTWTDGKERKKKKKVSKKGAE